MKLKYKFTLIQRILSYFISLEIEKNKSPYYLELILDRNKLVLNSQNANQSNQNLKSAFNELFYRQDIYKKEYNHVLILGLGLGSVFDLLIENASVNQFTAYENDTRLIAWLDKYYKTENLNIIPKSAEEFSIENKKYDLIIVDLFIDEIIPDFLTKSSYWGTLKSSLTPDGILIWNTLKFKEIKTEFDIKTIFNLIDEKSNENLFLIYQ